MRIALPPMWRQPHECNQSPGERLSISRVRDDSDPRNHPDQWVYFCGKPGSDFFSWGPISGDFLIPFNLIQKLSKSDMNDMVVLERENLLKTMAGIGLQSRGDNGMGQK